MTAPRRQYIHRDAKLLPRFNNRRWKPEEISLANEISMALEIEVSAWFQLHKIRAKLRQPSMQDTRKVKLRSFLTNQDVILDFKISSDERAIEERKAEFFVNEVERARQKACSLIEVFLKKIEENLTNANSWYLRTEPIGNRDQVRNAYESVREAHMNNGNADASEVHRLALLWANEVLVETEKAKNKARETACELEAKNLAQKQAREASEALIITAESKAMLAVETAIAKHREEKKNKAETQNRRRANSARPNVRSR